MMASLARRTKIGGLVIYECSFLPVLELPYLLDYKTELFFLPKNHKNLDLS